MYIWWNIILPHSRIQCYQKDKVFETKKNMLIKTITTQTYIAYLINMWNKKWCWFRWLVLNAGEGIKGTMDIKTEYKEELPGVHRTKKWLLFIITSQNFVKIENIEC